MAEKFTVYSFQLRPDDFTRFVGGDDEPESYSEEEYADVFAVGGLEKQDLNIAADVELPEEEEGVFTIEDEEDIFNLETEL